MANNIFEIENLKCAYADGGNVVLEIERLQIPEGRIVFFVGPSGIGKSTILETLGFMNNTIASVGKFEYCGADVSKAWSWPDERISNFRNSDFSFIFQENNLMPNFSAYENIMTTALFQGEAIVAASQSTRKVLEQLNLPTNDRPISQYSGGQRQRLAFARAILPNFKVLFGDEPTGNLDAKSADNLMKVMADIIHQRQATAVIVSHDMHLATEYADIIVEINRRGEGNQSFGYIDSQSIFNRENDEWLWIDKKFSKAELQQKLMNMF